MTVVPINWVAGAGSLNPEGTVIELFESNGVRTMSYRFVRR